MQFDPHLANDAPSPEELPQTSSNGSNINEAVSHGVFICIKTTR
jgi:hypothetical protein